MSAGVEHGKIDEEELVASVHQEVVVRRIRNNTAPASLLKNDT